MAIAETIVLRGCRIVRRHFFADGGFGLPLSARSRQAGFTLIEMLVVMAILAAATGLTVSMSAARSRALDLDVAVRQVVSAARLARSQAINGGASVLLLVDPRSRSLRVGNAALAPLPGSIALQVGGLEVGGLSGQPGLPRVSAIRFNPDGSASGGQIFLTDGKRRGDVKVAWLTGRITTARNF